MGNTDGVPTGHLLCSGHAAGSALDLSICLQPNCRHDATSDRLQRPWPSGEFRPRRLGPGVQEVRPRSSLMLSAHLPRQNRQIALRVPACAVPQIFPEVHMIESSERELDTLQDPVLMAPTCMWLYASNHAIGTRGSQHGIVDTTSRGWSSHAGTPR